MSSSTLPIPARVSGLAGVGRDLMAARLRAKQGDGPLFFAAIISVIVTTWLSLTMAAGTYMFYERWQSPRGLLELLIAEDPSFRTFGQIYFVLALTACALTVPSMLMLIAKSAQLGARGRERRLAIMRLLGVSQHEVVRLSLLETCIQTLVGIVIGTVIYVVSIPLWGGMEFLAEPISAGEMLLPLWLLSACLVSIVALALVSSWMGLKSVRISPLGVARRDLPPALKLWRLIFFIAAGAILFIVPPNSTDFRAMLGYIAILIMMMLAINAVGPFFLQVIARVLAHLPWPSVMWASRRIQANPRMAWSHSAGLVFLALIGGYLATMPITFNAGDSSAQMTFGERVQYDLLKGAMIALSVGFILAATSIYVSQLSDTFERAEQSVAAYKLGAPYRFQTRVNWIQIMGPVVTGLAFGVLLGTVLALPVAHLAAKEGLTVDPVNRLVFIVVAIVGLIISGLALALTEPTRRRIVRSAFSRRKE